MIRPATSRDLSEICALLSDSNLTTAGVSNNLDTFFVFERSGSIVALGGIELRGPFGLLRSVAVAHGHRGMGLASVICDRLEMEAVEHGARSIYLLTESAEHFFSKRGYAVVPRFEAPAEIASSEQFSSICPASAALMKRAAQRR